MKVKNTTGSNYPINKSVQVDVNTISADDGVVLPGQTLDLAKSMSLFEMMDNHQIRDGIYSGDLVFVVAGSPLEQTRSVEVYDSGPSNWAKVFDETQSNTNLRAGISQGSIYAINCRIG